MNKTEGKLLCELSTGAPAPTYEWFKNGELITYDKDSRYRLEMNGTLVIKEVDKDQDNVNYTCKAKNGNDSVTTVPIILGKKEIYELSHVTTLPSPSKKAHPDASFKFKFTFGLCSTPLRKVTKTIE